ncbi:hypothetical protein EV368DRAFT_81704 [Lentinula lateritia]|uniref:Uncharacterized protein n=1 Tax=Lentinula aff. lateritia TaxID=2804960 RepID=A0ACC1U0A3_9AGAR|nr:hypothetical protein F5876DRAFT_41956 [Lentinula aff. lateritia]KAJ3853312.1 hypothetical protein EV368DRAFT_81704 [Lentinula lateritia]
MPSNTTESSDIFVRITRAGKLANYVKYALESLEKNEKKAIVLHTLPKVHDNPEAPHAQQELQDASNASVTLITTPRLISVVEIIKREYLKDLEKRRSTRLVGLHQYNEIGSIGSLGSDGGSVERETDEQRAQRIAMTLEGKNFPKQQQFPYMRITLSVHELPDLVKKGATYQKPVSRTMSKAAKKRAKSNQKKAAQLNEAPEDAAMGTS